MKISMMGLAGGATLIGVLAMNNSVSLDIPNSASRADGADIVAPDDVPGTDPPEKVAQAIEVSGTVLDVGAATIVINGAGVTPVTIAVPATADITRNGKKAELSDIIPGDLADVDAVRKNDRLTATAVAAQKLL